MSSSSDNPNTVTDRGLFSKSSKDDAADKKKKQEEKTEEEEGGGGFIDKVKDFIHDIGEKIEEAVGFGKPSADVARIHVPHIGLHRADLVVDVLIKNPNPVPIPLVDIDYLIDSDGRKAVAGLIPDARHSARTARRRSSAGGKLAAGLIPDAGTIRAHGEETVKVPITLDFDDIRSTYADIKPGSIIPYLLRVIFLVDVPVFGRIKIPLDKSGEIPIPYKPDVDVDKIKFHHFSFEETTATIHLSLENKNDFDLGLNLLQYEMWLGDDSVVEAELTDSTRIEKQGITKMQIPFTFRPKDLGSAVWDMIRGRGTGYSIKGKIDVDTPFGNMKLPIDKVGGTTRLKKDDDDDERFGAKNSAEPSFCCIAALKLCTLSIIASQLVLLASCSGSVETR
uniref:Desiccation protectant Lea14-like protein n=1 Tax=Aegilops tauschii TaxID=37682 RepID=N1R206_AEGTA